MQTAEVQKLWRPSKGGLRAEGRLYGLVTDLRMAYSPPRNDTHVNFDSEGKIIPAPDFPHPKHGSLVITVRIENQHYYVPIRMDRILNYNPREENLVDYFRLYEVMIGRVGYIESKPVGRNRYQHHLTQIFAEREEASEHWLANHRWQQPPNLAISHCFNPVAAADLIMQP